MTQLRPLVFALCLLAGACVPPTSDNCDVEVVGATFSVDGGGDVLTSSECESLCRSEVMGAYPQGSPIVSCDLEESSATEDVYFCEWEAVASCDDGEATPARP